MEFFSLTLWNALSNMSDMAELVHGEKESTQKNLAEHGPKWRDENNVFVFIHIARAFYRCLCAMLLGNSKLSHDNKTFIELHVACSVRTGKYWSPNFYEICNAGQHFPSTDLTLVQ